MKLNALLLGSAYIFYSADGVSGWSELSKLVASDGAAGDGFGDAVYMWDGTVVVGASGNTGRYHL
jgi:hypothetical protein